MRTRLIEAMWLPWLVAIGVIGACGGKANGPGTTLDAYSNALGKRDFGAAYGLMSSKFKDQHSKEDFVRMMEENALEADETAAQLRNPRKRLVVTAEFQYGLDDTMSLIRERGAWRIASNPIQFYSQDTPREALRSFLRAYRLKRWDIMLRFIPNNYRETMDIEKLKRQFEGESQENIEEIMLGIEASIDAPIKDNGNEARMKYGEDNEVEMIREEGLWKIQDID